MDRMTELRFTLPFGWMFLVLTRWDSTGSSHCGYHDGHLDTLVGASPATGHGTSFPFSFFFASVYLLTCICSLFLMIPRSRPLLSAMQTEIMKIRRLTMFIEAMEKSHHLWRQDVWATL